MFSWVEKLFTGYSSDELQAESDSLDAKLAAQNQAALDRGAVTQAEYLQTDQNIENGRIDASAAIGGAFKEGLSDGIDNVRVTIGDVATAPVKLAFKLIDWRVWLLGGVALFFYLGGWSKITGLKNILAKK